MMNRNEEEERIGEQVDPLAEIQRVGARFGRTSRTEWVSKGSVLKAKRYKPNQKER